MIIIAFLTQQIRSYSLSYIGIKLNKTQIKELINK